MWDFLVLCSLVDVFWGSADLTRFYKMSWCWNTVEIDWTHDLWPQQLLEVCLLPVRSGSVCQIIMHAKYNKPETYTRHLESLMTDCIGAVSHDALRPCIGLVQWWLWSWWSDWWWRSSVKLSAAGGIYWLLRRWSIVIWNECSWKTDWRTPVAAVGLSAALI